MKYITIFRKKLPLVQKVTHLLTNIRKFSDKFIIRMGLYAHIIRSGSLDTNIITHPQTHSHNKIIKIVKSAYNLVELSLIELMM